MARIHRAARFGNAQEVADALAQGGDVNARSVHRFTPLMLAAQEGHLPVVQLLLAAGADPNLAILDEETVRLLLKARENEKLAQVLRDAGIDPNLPLPDAETALTLADAGEHEAVVQALLDAGGTWGPGGRPERAPASEDGYSGPQMSPEEFLAEIRRRLKEATLPDFPVLPTSALAIPFGAITQNGVVTEEDRRRFADEEGDRRLNEKYGHVFAGAQRAPVAECPNCGKPLTQFASLNGSDPRLQLGGWDRELRLLFCWRCPVAATRLISGLGESEADWYTETGQVTFLEKTGGEEYWGMAPFYYRVNADNTVHLLQYQSGPPGQDQPYKDYPDSFPEARLPLFRLNDDIQTALRWFDLPEIEIDWSAPGIKGRDVSDDKARDTLLGGTEWHQIGGQARLYAPKDYSMPCPLCGEGMPFFACIWNECPYPRGFVGDGSPGVFYHVCVHCFVLGAYELTD